MANPTDSRLDSGKSQVRLPAHLFDWRTGCSVSEQDATPWEDWLKGRGTTFGIHPSGAPCFLDRQRIESLDEYHSHNPYATPGPETETAFSSWRVEVAKGLLRQHAPATAQVLDIGCGPGDTTRALADECQGMQFCGLDASLTAVIDARTRHSRIPFVVGDAFEAPFAANSQDAIMLMNIWEHVTDPVSMAKSLRKVLKPEGVLVVTTPSRFRTENVLRALRGRDVSFRSVQHVTEYTVGQVFEQLRWAGFDVVEHHGDPMPPPEGAFLQKLRRATLGAALDGWRKATGSHHSFGPTVFFVARQTR